MTRLRELRTQKGLLQKDIAQFLGVDRTTYVKYESGASEPTFETLQRLASFFDVTVEYLMGFSDIKKTSPSNEDDANPELTKLRDVMDQMSPEQRQELLRYAKYLAASEHNPSDAT